LNDIQQRADFFISLGEFDQAINGSSANRATSLTKLFDMEAYRELLLLFNIGKEVVRGDDSVIRGEATQSSRRPRSSPCRR
jgi:hypothetical protein